MNLRLPLLLSNVAIWASFAWNTPIFYATKSVCSDYGVNNPLGCQGLLSSLILVCLILNHFLNAFVDAGRLGWPWRVVAPVLANLPTAFIIIRALIRPY